MSRYRWWGKMEPSFWAWNYRLWESRWVNCPNWPCSPVSHSLCLWALPQNSSAMWRKERPIHLRRTFDWPSQRGSANSGSKDAPTHHKAHWGEKRSNLPSSSVFKAPRMLFFATGQFKVSWRDATSGFGFWRSSVKKHHQSDPEPLGNELPSSWSHRSWCPCTITFSLCNSSVRLGLPPSPLYRRGTWASLIRTCVNTAWAMHCFQGDFVLI